MEPMPCYRASVRNRTAYAWLTRFGGGTRGAVFTDRGAWRIAGPCAEFDDLCRYICNPFPRFLKTANYG